MDFPTRIIAIILLAAFMNSTYTYADTKIDPLTISTKSKLKCIDRITQEQIDLSDLNDELVDAVLYCAKWLDEKNKHKDGN